MNRTEMILARLEDLVRGGQIPGARRTLLRFRPTRPTELARLRMAKIARRVGLIYFGLRTLHGAVFLTRSKSELRPSILTEYATLLSLNGNLNEALTLLEEVDTETCPDALLARSWCLFERWEYREATPLLEEYIRRQRDPYFRLAGQVNKAEVLFATGEIDQCLFLAGACCKEALACGFLRLRANALLIYAQACSELGQWRKAKSSLNEALKIFGNSGTTDSILIHRQIAINEALETKNQQPLLRFRDVALKARAWESLREIEFQSLRVAFKQRTFDRLWYGTPYPGFRKRLEQTFSVKPSPLFTWGASGENYLSLQTGKVFGIPRQPSVSGQNLILINFLLRDFYNPPGVGQIFACLYQKEKFDIFSAPDRIHQALKRLRRYFEMHDLPLQLVADRGTYQVKATEKFAIHIKIDDRISEKTLSPIDLLTSKFGKSNAFTTSEVSKALRISKATANRLLNSDQSRKLIERLGNGRRSRYRILPV